MSKSRREALGLLGAGIASLSGCSGLNNAAEAAADAAETETPTSQHTIPRDIFNSSAGTPTPTATSRLNGGDLRDIIDNRTRARTDTATDNGIDLDELEPVPIYDVDHSDEVEAGSYLYWDLDLPSRVGEGVDALTVQYDAVVRDGPAVDFFFLRQEEFDSYSNGKNFLYVVDASATNTKYGQVETTIRDIRPYVFLVDNTNGGDAVPPTSDSTAEIDLDLTVQ